MRRIAERFEASDLPMPAQVADVVDVEALSGGRAATLPVEDAGDDRIRVVNGQAPHEFDGVIVGAQGRECDASTEQISNV